MKLRNRLLVLFGLLWFVPALEAETLTIGVAANFRATLDKLVLAYQVNHPELKVRLSVASTGTLYAQIISGAPFDLLFAADTERPEQLYQRGLATRPLTYASGRLVLISRTPEVKGLSDLADYQGRIALANPETAPYGAAAMTVLKALDTRHEWSLVYGNNVAQAYQFFRSGNVQVGLLAASLLTPAERLNAYAVPAHFYPVIRQDAVALKGIRLPLASAFLEFVTSPEARETIESMGYDVDGSAP